MKEITSKITTFLNRQSKNYTVLVIYGVLASIFGAGGWRGSGGGQYVTLYIVALGATPTMLGLLRSVGSAVRSGISTPIGWMMDRYNLKKLMLIGMILRFVSPLMYILTGDIGFYL